MGIYENAKESANYIKSRLPQGFAPQIALVLGSGLGGFAEKMEVAAAIKYADIPHFPLSTVMGHSGNLVAGTLFGKQVLCMQGRFHYYEGYSMAEVAYPVQVMHLLGAESLVLTNAAGGVNESFSPGDLMLISDHFKLLQDSPLRGKNIDEFGPRFCDMSDVYTKAIRQKVKALAQSAGIPLQEGVYAHMAGPSFETPAEIRMLRVLGADAVGMSTVPEAICAAHCGMKVLGISCISNMAAGILNQPLSHQEVLETGQRVAKKFTDLLLLAVAEVL